jgi:hypothetical protein
MVAYHEGQDRFSSEELRLKHAASMRRSLLPAGVNRTEGAECSDYKLKMFLQFELFRK